MPATKKEIFLATHRVDDSHEYETLLERIGVKTDGEMKTGNGQMAASAAGKIWATAHGNSKVHGSRSMTTAMFNNARKKKENFLWLPTVLMAPVRARPFWNV